MRNSSQDKIDKQNYSKTNMEMEKNLSEENGLENLLPNFLMEKLIIDESYPEEIPNGIWNSDETSNNYAVIKVINFHFSYF